MLSISKFIIILLYLSTSLVTTRLFYRLIIVYYNIILLCTSMSIRMLKQSATSIYVHNLIALPHTLTEFGQLYIKSLGYSLYKCAMINNSEILVFTRSYFITVLLQYRGIFQ